MDRGTILETLLANLGWGGKRKGAGRPATGRELQKIYATDEEMMALRERLAELREEEKVTRNPGIGINDTCVIAPCDRN